MLMRSLLFLVVLIGVHQPAFGHKMLLMAWLEGEQLMVEVAFGDGSFAAHTRVSVLDAASSETLLSGNTDDQGFWQVLLPAEVLNRDTELLVRANDGAGHMVEQLIDADELRLARPAASLETVTRAASTPTALLDDRQETTIRADAEMIRQIVQEAVRQETAPLRREILALRQSGPGVTEIMGGIGYIIGLACLGALLLRKRQKTADRTHHT